MMGNARRISMEEAPSDATQWISRTNEELDSIRRGDYRNWADRHSEPEPPVVEPPTFPLEE
jgi:hypothetical protein